jgi:hypothetical protein
LMYKGHHSAYSPKAGTGLSSLMWISQGATVM